MIRKLLFAAALVAASTFAGAAEWPTKPVRIVVPFSAGGATDGPARLLAQQLGEMWHQSVVVDNKTGAGGSIGAAEVARATADGYTLLFPSGAVMTASQFIYLKLSYDPAKDFVPITKVVSAPQVLVVANSSPLKTTQDLIAAAKSSERKLTFGHAGIGSQSHLAAEYFLSEAGIQAVSVPYKGDPPAVVDIYTGSVDFGLINLGAAIGLIESGRLRALAVTSSAPIPKLPSVPTIASVLPGFENSGWFGIVAPHGVPAAIVDKIARDVRTVLAQPDVRSRLAAMGFATIPSSSPSEMGAEMAQERKRWSKVVAERSIQVLQ